MLEAVAIERLKALLPEELREELKGFRGAGLVLYLFEGKADFITLEIELQNKEKRVIYLCTFVEEDPQVLIEESEETSKGIAGYLNRKLLEDKEFKRKLIHALAPMFISGISLRR